MVVSLGFRASGLGFKGLGFWGLGFIGFRDLKRSKDKAPV